MHRRKLNLIGEDITFEGAISLEHTPNGVIPWRIPYKQRELFEPDLLPRAASPAGVRLTLISDTSSLQVSASIVSVYAPMPDEKACFDLIIDGRFSKRFEGKLDGQVDVHYEDLPDGEHRLEVYLPQAAKTVVRSVTIDDGASAKQWRDIRSRWLVYGSSITQCRRSLGPSETWPALASRTFDLNLTCLGFGSNCHMEPMVAKMIRDQPADYISLCLGINNYGGTLSQRTFRAAVIGLIQTVRENHPDTPIICISPIYCPKLEDKPGPTGMTLNLMRKWIKEAVEVFKNYGDKNISCMNGLDILSHNDKNWLSEDQVHPHVQGYYNIARRYEDLVMEGEFGLVKKYGK